MTEPTLAARARRFRELHEVDALFVMPCAWDAGSARIFEDAGFACVGTTSGGVNWSMGRPDYVYETPRAEMLAAYGQIARSVEVPVSGDLENGYGDTPDDAAETILLAIADGMVGGSIEDRSSASPPQPLPIDLAAERIEAARSAADTTLVDFVITARAESIYTDVGDPIADAIERANRYVAAGADCIFVPGLDDLATIGRVVAEIDGPLSVGVGSGGADLTVAQLESVGVRRVSTGGGNWRAVYAQLAADSAEMLTAGRFGYAPKMLSSADIDRLFE